MPVLSQSGVPAAPLPHETPREETLHAPESAHRVPIDIRQLPWIKRLAVDYAFDFGRLSEFFTGNPGDPAVWRAVIERAQRHPRDRSSLADLIEAQQRRRSAPAEALTAAAQFRRPDSVAIVTGQQAGLFGGPLFTLLKAITTLQLAERVQRDHGVPAVAVFWIDAEDHDWDEVKACGVLDSELHCRTVSVGDPPGAGALPVARVELDGTVQSAVDELAAVLAPTEFSASLIEQLRRNYTPGHGMADAFAAWLESVLGPHGLVVYDASDPAAKPLAAPVFTHEVEHRGESAALARAAGAALESRGYHAQVHPNADAVSLFHLNDGREPIRMTDHGFVIGGDTESFDTLRERVRREPQRFSPNVLLRPLVQDTLFPTVCYVAGPNELAYLAQLRGIYDAFGVPMPLIQPRATATVVDANAMRFLTRSGLSLPALQARDESALNALLESQIPASIEAALQDAARTVDERMGHLASELTRLDATLEGAARSAVSRMQDDLKKLHGKIIQAAKRKNETLRRQFQHAQTQAFPAGRSQEREVGFVYFLNKYGPALVDRLRGELPLDMGVHWVVTI